MHNFENTAAKWLSPFMGIDLFQKDLRACAPTITLHD
jgi:hypothetical protein